VPISTLITIAAFDYFVPNDLASLQIWYDGSDPLGTGTAPANGTSIATWVDKSGKGRNATAIYTPPVYSNDGSNGGVLMNYPTTNASNIFNFNGSWIVGQYFTGFIVERAQAVNDPGGAINITAGSGATSGTNLLIRYYNVISSLGQMNLDYITGANITTTNGLFSSFTTAAAQPTRIWDFSQLPSDRRIYLNGTSLANDTNNTLLNSWPGARLGSEINNTRQYSGYMRDFIFYNGQLPTFYRQQTEGYLAWKWGLQSNLPADHPYRNTRPLNPGLISPYSAPNLSFWLDATRISTISSGTALTRWNDVSSNAYTGTAVNGPTYQSTIYNGYMPAVTFNGTNQYINFGSNVLNMRTSSISIFAVTQTNAIAGSVIAKSLSGGVVGRWYLIHEASLGTTLQAQTTTTNVYLNQGSTTTGSPQLLNGFWDRANAYLYRNASLLASQSASDTTYDFNTSNLLLVGGYNDSSGQANPPNPSFYLNGSIGEILVYMSAPIVSMRQKIEGYLSWKWGLTQNLPGNHPYKFYPPLSNYSSIAINTSTIFATNFNAGNDIGFTNFSNTRLVSSSTSTITGFGSAYNTTWGGTSSIYPVKSFTSITTTTATFCISVYRTGEAASGTGLFNYRSGTTDVIQVLVPFSSPNNTIGYTWNNQYWNWNSGATIPLNTWTHIAITISPSAGRVYINGSNVATLTAVHNSQTFNSLTIGSDTTSDPTTRSWPGLIDNVRFYASTMTSNEIQAIYYNTQFI
jgi:hypothetical protein